MAYVINGLRSCTKHNSRVEVWPVDCIPQGLSRRRGSPPRRRRSSHAHPVWVQMLPKWERFIGITPAYFRP